MAESGGQGESVLLEDRGHRRADAVMLRRAIVERWPVDRTLRERTICRLSEILESEDERNALGAARALVAAESQNQADEHHDDDVAAKAKDQALAAAALSSSMTDEQKIALYVAAGRLDLMPPRLLALHNARS